MSLAVRLILAALILPLLAVSTLAQECFFGVDNPAWSVTLFGVREDGQPELVWNRDGKTVGYWTAGAGTGIPGRGAMSDDDPTGRHYDFVDGNLVFDGGVYARGNCPVASADFGAEAAKDAVNKAYYACYEDHEQEFSEAERGAACFTLLRQISALNMNGHCLDLESSGDDWQFRWFACKREQ